MELKSVALMLAVLAASACGSGSGQSTDTTRADDSAAVDSMGIAPSDVATVTVRTSRNLRESSALAMSREQPGVLFTINDSGNEAVLFALDTSGADRGAWRVKRAKNVDWEALAVGPCAAVASSCVYIGDVGDNDAVHSTRSIYRLPEPRAAGSSKTGDVDARQAVTFTYADGRHDVEAMYVAANGDLFLITKRALADAALRLRPALVFRIPAGAWGAKSASVAELVDSLSIVPGSAAFRTITDASLAPDGKHVAIRTYSQLFVYATDANTGRVSAAAPVATCNLASLGEAQGEGITWVASSGRFAFSSEGRGAPLHLANCPVAR